MEFPRWGYVALFALCLLAGLLFATGLLADLYGQIAAESRFRADASARRLSAAREAAQLQPWNVAFRERADSIGNTRSPCAAQRTCLPTRRRSVWLSREWVR
jgi:hypothetical protein